MLQPSKISRSSLDLQNTDLQSILADTALGRLWQALASLLRLPNDLTSFLLFLLALSVLCGGLILHIHLSSRILLTQFDIADKRARFNAIEQKNSEIVWHINQANSLDKIKQRATALGYVDMPDHQYIGTIQLESVLAFGAPAVDNPNVDSRVNSQVMAEDSRLAADNSQLPSNSLPLHASSSPNTVAMSLANPISSVDPMSQNPDQVDQQVPGFAPYLGQLRQWIQGWLSTP